MPLPHQTASGEYASTTPPMAGPAASGYLETAEEIAAAVLWTTAADPSRNPAWRTVPLPKSCGPDRRYRLRTWPGSCSSPRSSTGIALAGPCGSDIRVGSWK
jgi:hypothetical protein